MERLYPWIVFLHVVGGFKFALAHGVAAAVALRLRRERELERVRTLLDLSSGATGVMYWALLVLLAAGIGAAFVAGLWGKGWIWAAIVLLVALLAFMYVRATPYFGALRRAASLPYFDGRKGHDAEATAAAALGSLLASPRPMEIASVGYLGLVVILWLMVVKPF